MIADVCAALLQNLMVKSDYCSHFLDTEYESLEDYTVKHHREIGKYMKNRTDSIRSRPLGLYSLGLGLGALLICNCVAWAVVRHQNKKRMEREMRNSVNEQI